MDSPATRKIPLLSNINHFKEVASLIVNTKGDNRPYTEIAILGESWKALLDSGATCSVIGGKLVDMITKMGFKQYPVEGAIRTADNTAHAVSFYAHVPVEYNGLKKVLPVICVKSLPDTFILGMDFWSMFGVKVQICGIELTVNSDLTMIRSLSKEQQARLEQAIGYFPSSKNTGKLGRTHIYFHKIDTGSAAPIKQRYYPTSKFLLDDINKEVDRMLQMDVIEEALCCPWNSPVVAVKKKDGSMRLCLDARKLNTVITQEAYPIPQIASIMNNLSGSRFLSSVDLEAAFWQIPLEEGSKQKTAFTIPQRGHYQFKVVPFGLSTASQALSRVMNYLFINLEPRVFAYLDDLVIATNSFEEHVELLKEVARRLDTAGLTINTEKSTFCRRSLKYLGYVLDENGWNVDKEKTEAISGFPTPTSKKQVQRFLGMAGWYRRFIRDFSKTAAPLTELTKARAKFIWSEACEKAFNMLKQQLCTAPVLRTPDYTKPFAIACDASDIAIGAVLTQETDGNEGVIAYFSQKLSPSERNYSVTERECLAVIRAIEKFRGYVEGSHFVVYCDHSSLTYLKTMKNPTPLMARWIVRLNAFACEIRYRKGTSNVVPDCLSRIGDVNVVSTDDVSVPDAWYDDLLGKIQEDGDNFPDFRLQDGKIYKNCLVTDPLGIRGHRWKEVVRGPLRKEIIRRFHDLPTAAHLGFDRTLQKIQLHYYWPKMAIDIKRYVQSCEVCKASKAPNTTLTPAMGTTKPAKLPWELISIDWVGPMTRSRNGNTVLLVIVDWITKFVIVEPFRIANAQLMVNYLESYVFLRFSTPRIIVTDNGSQFTSLVFRALLRRYKIEHMRTAFYTPMCNAAERTNRTIVTCVRALLDEDQRGWDENLQQIVCAINTAKHDTLGCSPYFANFGRDHVLFTEQYALASMNTDQCSKAEQDQRLKTVQNIHRFIVDRIRTAHEKSKQRYDLRTRERKFAVGDLVWRRSFAKSSAIDHRTKKLGPKFIPCYVREVKGANNYLVEDVKTSSVGVYHAKDLKAD